MESTSGARVEDRSDGPGRPPAADESADPRAHRPRSRMRAVYFGAASFWGFVAGSAAVIGCLRVTGQAVAFTPGALWILAGAATVAVVGEVVLALAYREAAHRSRL